MANRYRSEPPRTALRVPDEAAASLGVGRDFFREHVLDELRVVRRGRLVLVDVDELRRWLEENAEATLGNAG